MKNMIKQSQDGGHRRRHQKSVYIPSIIKKNNIFHENIYVVKSVASVSFRHCRADLHERYQISHKHRNAFDESEQSGLKVDKQLYHYV